MPVKTLIVDLPFLLATLAFGWGLSLATYRMFAQHYGWPMGTLQAEAPVVPVLLGLFCLAIAFTFAAFRGTEYGGWVIILLGLLFAVFWTGFLRVASQTSIFLAPIGTLLLVIFWLGYQDRIVEEYRKLRYRESSSLEMIVPPPYETVRPAIALRT
ncbi:MAG: hypothetical protein RLZ98_2471 [Pseudomonadota bacterium]|jgi:hypothetical protein